MLSDLLIISLFNKVTFHPACFKPSRYNAGKNVLLLGYCASCPSCVDKMVKALQALYHFVNSALLFH